MQVTDAGIAGTILVTLVGLLVWLVKAVAGWFRKEGWPMFIEAIRKVGQDSKDSAQTVSESIGRFIEHDSAKHDQTLLRLDRQTDAIWRLREGLILTGAVDPRKLEAETEETQDDSSIR